MDTTLGLWFKSDHFLLESQIWNLSPKRISPQRKTPLPHPLEAESHLVRKEIWSDDRVLSGSE